MKINKAVEEREAEIEKIDNLYKLLLDFEFSEKDMAIILWKTKRKVCKKYQAIKSIALLERVKPKNERIYGNIYGPDVKWLVKKGMSYKEIIIMSITSGAEYDPLSERFKIKP